MCVLERGAAWILKNRGAWKGVGGESAVREEGVVGVRGEGKGVLAEGRGSGASGARGGGGWSAWRGPSPVGQLYRILTRHGTRHVIERASLCRTTFNAFSNDR